jgi:polar amino acid transport system substrate-binding protein
MGMDIEVLNRVAYELNMKVEYIKMNFAELLDALQAGKADLVGGCLSVTPERQQKVDFVHPYYKGGMAVLARYPKKKEAPKAE